MLPELLMTSLICDGLRLGVRHTLTGPCLASGNAAVARQTWELESLVFPVTTMTTWVLESLVFPVPTMTHVVPVWHKTVTQSPRGAEGPRESSKQDVASP